MMMMIQSCSNSRTRSDSLVTLGGWGESDENKDNALFSEGEKQQRKREAAEGSRTGTGGNQKRMAGSDVQDLLKPFKVQQDGRS